MVLNSYHELEKYFTDNHVDNLFIVCFDIIKEFSIYNFLEKLPINKTYFSDFQPNPTYESVCKGIELFKKSNSSYILAIGGGSSLDVAKCIKLFATLDENTSYLNQKYSDNDITLIAVPTTAGTGSEATRYAVIYYEGKKCSVTHDSIIPSVVLFDEKMLEKLPLYQKKATTLDALSHAIESYWSINSTDESKKYSKEAIKIILNNFNKYLDGDNSVNKDMLYAANLAGKAINITATTAGHAMCYKLTSLYGVSHGHAACLVNAFLLPFMIDNTSKSIDKRGKDYLLSVFNDLVSIFNLTSLDELKNYLNDLLEKLDLYNIRVNNNDLDELVNSVNIERLNNNPVKLEKEDIYNIYHELFIKIEKRQENGS